MSIRPFDWRDLPALYRYRNDSVFLHSSLVLTRGPLLISGSVLSALTTAIGLFTSVSAGGESRGEPLIGQIIHTPGSQYAQLTFLTPAAALDSSCVPALVDHLATQVGERGAFRLLADVDEHTQAFDALRGAAFAIYARQRIWQLKYSEINHTELSSWRTAADRDMIAVRSLYNNLIPGLVQQVEPFPPERLHGMVYLEEGELLAYVELKYGHRGIWAQPFIHPDAEEVADRLIALLQNLPYRRSRPVYLCIRSYQSWLESAIQEIGAEPGPRQAVMVKQLVLPQKAVRSFTIPALEGGHPEVSAPIARSESE